MWTAQQGMGGGDMLGSEEQCLTKAWACNITTGTKQPRTLAESPVVGTAGNIQLQLARRSLLAKGAEQCTCALLLKAWSWALPETFYCNLHGAALLPDVLNNAGEMSC